MKKEKEFRRIVRDFKKAVDRKGGQAFLDAVHAFMNKNQFEEHIIKPLLDIEDVRVVLFTDNVKNDVGIILLEIVGEESNIMVANRNEYMTRLLEGIAGQMK